MITTQVEDAAVALIKCESAAVNGTNDGASDAIQYHLEELTKALAITNARAVKTKAPICLWGDAIATAHRLTKNQYLIRG